MVVEKQRFLYGSDVAAPTNFIPFHSTNISTAHSFDNSQHTVCVARGALMCLHVRERVAKSSKNWYAICVTSRATTIKTLLLASLVSSGWGAFSKYCEKETVERPRDWRPNFP